MNNLEKLIGNSVKNMLELLKSNFINGGIY